MFPEMLLQSREFDSHFSNSGNIAVQSSNIGL